MKCQLTFHKSFNASLVTHLLAIMQTECLDSFHLQWHLESCIYSSGFHWILVVTAKSVLTIHQD